MSCMSFAVTKDAFMISGMYLSFKAAENLSMSAVIAIYNCSGTKDDLPQVSNLQYFLRCFKTARCYFRDNILNIDDSI